jgi:hypothetical protein
MQFPFQAQPADPEKSLPEGSFSQRVEKLLTAIQKHEAGIAEHYPEVYKEWQRLMKALDSYRE